MLSTIGCYSTSATFAHKPTQGGSWEQALAEAYHYVGEDPKNQCMLVEYKDGTYGLVKSTDSLYPMLLLLIPDESDDSSISITGRLKVAGIDMTPSEVRRSYYRSQANDQFLSGGI